MASPGSVLIVVENLPVPFDRRVWMEATTLADAGYNVTVISRKAPGLHLRPGSASTASTCTGTTSPVEGDSAPTYLFEYARALWARDPRSRAASTVSARSTSSTCATRPTCMFVIAAWFKVRNRVRVIFDHHDLNPELYEVKYGRRDFFYRLLRLAERLTFLTADVVITTGESYRAVALGRGRKKPEDVFIVRSAPDLSRFQPVPPDAETEEGPAVPRRLRRRHGAAGGARLPAAGRAQRSSTPGGPTSPSSSSATARPRTTSRRSLSTSAWPTTSSSPAACRTTSSSPGSRPATCASTRTRTTRSTTPRS